MQGIQPSPHDTTKDYAVVFYAKDFVKEDDTIQVTDVLLFFASMETVLGGDKTIDKFDVWIKTWWDNCDIKNKRIKVFFLANIYSHNLCLSRRIAKLDPPSPIRNPS